MRKFSVTAVFLLTLFLSTAVFVNAQLFGSAYEIKTLHIFPAEIKAIGWTNPETITFQNLDDYSLLQEFNKINSATIDSSRQNLLEPESDETIVEEPVDTPPIESPEATTSDAVNVSTTSSEIDNTDGTNVSPINNSSTTIEFGIDEDLPIATLSTTTALPVPVVSATQTTTTEVDSVDSSQQPEEPKATTTVLRKVESVFALAVEAVTSFFEGSTTSLQVSGEEVVIEEVELDVVSQTASNTASSSIDSGFSTEDTSSSTASTSELIQDENNEIDTEIVLPESESSSSSSDDTNNEQNIAVCTDDCKPYVIELSDFALPFEEGVEISGAQLRLSFAAQKKPTRELVPTFDIKYSTDSGSSWQSAGSIIIDDEVSNSLNGGYYLFALPEISNQDNLQNLKVQLVYAHDPELFKELYVESVWLELFTLEATDEEKPQDILSLLQDDGYNDEILSGDTLVLPSGEELNFNFTDENEDETLIIKTDKTSYSGLTKATTYFSVTNESNKEDEFTLQTYFPKGVGEVSSIKEYNQNKPKKVVVPEYRPFIYHCEAGWEYVGPARPDSLEELSRQFSPVVKPENNSSSSAEINSDGEQIIFDDVSSSSGNTTLDSDSTVEFSLPTSSDSIESTVDDIEIIPATNTTTTGFILLNSVSELMQFGTTTAVDNESDKNTEDVTDEGTEEELVDSYMCRNTNIVRACDSIEGDNTACKIDNFKVDEHHVTKYVSGWDDQAKQSGSMPKPSLFKRAIQFIGFGPDKKEVPESFEVRAHTPNTYSIKPGETKYFEMEISFPPFTNGEYWIEAIGDSEYGLLDPFWSSQWDYRLPITIDNTANDRALDEDQVFLELDSSMTDFWNEVNSDGSDIRFVYEEEGNVDDWYGIEQPETDWYDRDWGRRAPITIQSSEVASTLTDFPVYVDLSTLGDDFFDNVQTDGDDIRITEADGITEVPYELVAIDTGAGTGELYFKASTLSNSVDTNFFIYHDNDSATPYSDSAVYGAENVWTNGYEAVYHMSDFNDSTANNRNGTAVGSPVQTNGSYDLGGDTDYIQMPSNFGIFDGTDSFTWQVRFVADATAPGTAYQTSPVLLSVGDENNAFFTFGDGEPGNTMGFRYQGWTTPVVANSISTGVDYLLTMSYNQPGADMRMYLNGSETDSAAGTISVAGGAYPGNYIGGLQTSEPDRGFDGRINEVRILSNPLSANWVAAENTNIYTPTTFYSTSTNETVPELEEIGQWSHRIPVTIQASAIDSPLTDFPVYVDLSTLGDDFFDNVQTDGDDIRITEADGITEVPYELVAIDTGSGMGELHFKASSLSDSVDTTFYIYFGNIDAPAHADTDEFGANNVWTNFTAVYHLEEELAGKGNTGLYTDSTSNDYHADDYVDATGQLGQLGSGQQIQGRDNNNDDYINIPNSVLNGATDVTSSYWFRTGVASNQALISAGGGNEYLIFMTSSNLAFYAGGAIASFGITSPIDNNWHHMAVVRNDTANQVNLYIDGQPDNQNPLSLTMGALSIPSDCLVLGQEQDGCLTYDDAQAYDGYMDEVRFRPGVTPAAVLDAEFANQSDPASFYSTSTTEELSPARLIELDYWIQHFDSTNDEADVWVQVSDIDANATGTIYIYYGNDSATSDSDPYEPFTYTSPREHYFVVNGAETSDIDIYSLIDGNEIVVDGATTYLDRGESMILSGYTATTGVSVLGPITSFNDADGSVEPLVPISFATTTFIVPSQRNNEVFHVYSPFSSADVDVYIGAAGSPASSATIAGGDNNSFSVSVSGGSSIGVVESTEPVLLMFNNSGGDSFVVYPPTLRDLYGHDNQDYFFSTPETSGTLDINCSSGASSASVGISRGQQGGNSICAAGANGTGDTVRLHGQDVGIFAIGQRDGDGTESTSFMTEPEMGTEYIIPGDADYVAIVCTPRFGAVNIEIQSVGGATIDSGTCTPNSADDPGTLVLDGGNGNALSFAAGSFIVATNDVPFWPIFDANSNDDETNTWSAVQARTFIENQTPISFGAQELAIDAQYEQVSYQWYENIDNQIPTPSLATEGTALVDSLAIESGEDIRLRMNLRANYATGTLTSTAFSLQYAEAETCSAATDWFDIGDVGSTTAAFSGYANDGVTDGSVLSSLLLSQSTVSGTYEEENYSSFIQTEIGMGEIAEWDWSLKATNVNSNTSYCFRMIRANGEELSTYSDYPRLETAGPPLAPTPLVYFDNEKTADLTPVLEFAAVDTTGDEIHYQVQIDNNVDFSSATIDRDSITNFLEFENLNNSSDKAPFSSGARIRFTAPSSLSDSTTYWWRVRALDPDGSNTWGEWSDAWSFTTDSAVSISEWHQTTGDQFSTNSLTSLSTSSGAVSVSGASGIMYSSSISFSDATIGNAWGEVEWNDSEVSGNILYQVQYFNGSSWALVPDSEISGNSTGIGTSPINILNLNTDTYETIRLVANFNGSNLSVQDWTVRWGLRVDTPNLLTPFDHEKKSTTTPTFTFTSTDPQNDDLEYELAYGTDYNFVSSTTVSAGTYASGAVGTYTIPSGTPLSNGVTYWWKVRAKDTLGGNAWSPWSTADSFTVDNTVTVSTWFQTTEEQFRTGVLEGAEAVPTDEVNVSSRIGEYGTVVLDDGVWTTVNTNRTYNDMVVVGSPEYDSNQDNARTVRIRNKQSGSFEVLVDNFDSSLTGSTTIDYIVMEAGTWEIEEDSGSIQVIAGTAENVSNVKSRAYDNSAGTQIVFSSPFSSAPAVLASVSSDNDSTWVGTHVDDGSNRANEVPIDEMFISLARSFESAVHDPEDVDYIVFDVGDGANDGVEFESFNSGVSVGCCSAGYAVSYQSAFSGTPAITVVHNNAANGSDGAFAVKDTQTLSTASTLYLEAPELGTGANNHANEVVSIVAFEDASGFIVREFGSGNDLSGTIRSETIEFNDGAGPKFEQFYWTDTQPGTSTITYQVEYQNSSDEWNLIPDIDLPNNSTGTTTDPIDLSALDAATYDVIRLVANLACTSGNCPSLQDWTLEWSEGVTVSGTLKESDLLTSVASGTVRVAVNGTLLGSTGSVSSGVWSINNVTAFPNDVVTIFVDDAVEEDEAVSVLVYDGVGNITGVELFENHLSISADEIATTTNASLSAYDYSVSGDEDIFFDVNAANDLSTCAVGDCLTKSIYLGAGNIYRPDSTGSGNIETHSIRNDGQLKLDGNTVRMSGHWTNNSIFSPDTSTVIFTATTTDLVLGTWYDESWSYRLPITIDSDNIDADLTNFPVYLDLSDLPADFFNNVQADGDDIRITASDEVTEVPYELVSINTGSDTGQLHFKAPSVSSATDTVFYIYYGNSSASGYAVTDTYGRNNVWTNGYEAVYHLEETGSGTAGEYVDSTGNGFDADGGGGSGASTPAVTSGVLGNAQDFDGSNDYIDTNAFASDMNLDGNSAKTITAWAYTEAFGQGGIWNVGASNNVQDYSLRTNGGTDNWRAQYWGTDIDFNYDSDFKWVHFALDYDGANERIYANGANVASGAFALNTTNGYGVLIGRWRTADEFQGWIDEVRIATTSRSAAWYDAEYINQNTSTSFYSVGAQTDLPLVSSSWKLDDVSGTLVFNNLTFGESTSVASWEPLDNLDVNGNITINQGTFDRGVRTINLAGNLLTGTNGLWDGVGTTTFDGNVTRTWTDNSTTKQNVGRVLVDGTAKTVNIASGVLAQSITIGANDILGGGGSYDIQIQGDFKNNNVFTPSTSRLVVVGTSTNSTITVGGSNLYAFRASTTNGAVAFTESTITLQDNFEVATGTVTLPTTLLRVGGSFINTGGVFAHNNAEVRFTGSGSETITLQGTEFLNTFYDLRFDGTGNWSFLDTAATTTNSFTIDRGQVTFPAGDLTIGREFETNAPGSFVANNGEVIFLARSTDSITTNGSSFNDVRIREGDPVRGGNFDAEWLYRDVIIIQSSQIDSDLTDFPVYLDLSDFDSAFFSNINSDGGDIRITTADGVTEVPREIVSASTTLQTGEVYFKAPSLSSTTNTTFYVYYGNATATDYAIDDTYGAENVWTNDYLGVYHLQETSSGASGEFIDSTANDNDGTGENTLPVPTSGKIGGGQDMNAGHIDLGTGFTDITTNDAYTKSAWINLDGAGDYSIVSQWGGGSDGVLWWADAAGAGTGFCHYPGGVYTPTSVFDSPGNDCQSDDSQQIGSWQYLVATYDADAANEYVDGVAIGLETTGLSFAQSAQPMSIGSEQGNNNNRTFNGQMDEVRISSVERTADWIAAEYRNMATSSDFYSVTSGVGTPARIFADANVTALGDVFIESGVVQLPSSNFSIGGSFDNNDSFSAGTGAVTFNANTAGHTVSAGSSLFYDLEFNGVGGEWLVNENATATNSIILENGNSFTLGSSLVLESTGTFFNNMSNASTTWTGSTLKLSSGSDFSINDKNNSGDTYNVISLSGDTDISMWNSTAATYGTSDTSSIYSQDHAGVNGDLYIYGNYTRDTGTEYWSYATDFDGTDLVASSSQRQVDVRIANTASVLVGTSTLQILGAPTASTTVDAISGNFSLTANYATVTAQYFTMSGTNASGFNLSASTTVSSFDDFTFTIPTSATAVTVDSSTIDTNPASQFFNTNFISGAGDVNVTLTGSPTSYWWFRNGAGDRYGEAFDIGDGDPGSIRWDDSQYGIAISGTVFGNDGVTPITAPLCNDITPVVTVVVDGGATFSAPCSSVDGTYTIDNVSYIGDPNITVYLNSNRTQPSTVTLRSETTGSGTTAGGTGNFTVNKPATVVSGDTLVLIVGEDDDDVAFSAPAGWTGVQLGTAAGNDIRTGIFYKYIADSSEEPATYTFSGDIGEGYSYWIGSLADVSPTNPQDVSFTGRWVNSQDDTTPNAASVTTATAGSYVLAATYLDNDTTLTAPGAPWSTRAVNVTSSDSNNLVVSSRIMASPGATGATTVGGGSAGDDSNNGQFPFRRVTYSPSTVRAAVVTKTPTADITDLNLYQDYVIVRHEDISPLTIADMIFYDEDDDLDIRFVAATGSPDTLTVRPDTGLMVASSSTFVPNGNITLQSGGSGATQDGSLHLANYSTFTALGTESHSIGGSFFNDIGSVFNPASSTITFTATTSGKGITNANSSTLDFNEVQFTGVGGGWNLTADIEVAGDMIISTGTVSGTGDITMNGTLGGNGVLSMGGGTTTILTSTTLGGTSAWTFYDLILGDGSTVSTTTRSENATTTIAGSLTIRPAHYLDTGSSVWDLAGSGTVFVENGTLLQDTSTFIYSGGTGANVLSTTYYNLKFGGFAGTPTYTFGNTGVLVENNLTVGGAVSSTAQLNTSDPVVSVLGDVFIDTNGVLSLSNSSPLTISGNYDNNGTLTANNGTVIFDSADSYTVAAGSSTLANVSLTGAGAVIITENATSTGLFNIGTSSDFTQQTGTRLAVGGQLSINSSITDWTGSTLYLYGGGDYTVSSKTGGDTFGNLNIGPSTEIRLWNSSAVSTNVDSTGSLYSQDHAGVDGDLYIYGNYQETSRNDHWSYATDFDGEVLGSGRPVSVYLADGATTTWTGGSISVIGSTTATTTIQNQGSGDYSIVIGGNTVADWRYANIRDINDRGLIFTGTPNVSSFRNIDLLVEENNATAMTVGGTVITASPAKTFSDVVFNYDIGVTGAVNVTATGTTLSGWRFTAHSGNLDGEADDDDPAGDPGYIIWDDSVAIISISGNVYEADGSTVSSACDNTTTNIVLSIAGSVAQNASSSCSSADGSYLISGVSFGSLDELMLYINGNAAKGITVSKDPISSIADMDIYENHVIVRHENTDPMSIADMAVWDSSDDVDIPYTAVTGSPDTLTLPADTKLLIWTNKGFTPAGNVTLTGGGAGANYDGSFEALAGATFTGAPSESHSIGGSFEFGAGSSFISATSTILLTTDDAARIINTNGDAFYNLVLNGAGSWLITDADTDVNNDLTITAGNLTLGTGTTTIRGSFVNNGGFNANGGLLNFTAPSGSEIVTLGGSDVAEIMFNGTGSWTVTDVNATTSESFTVSAGTVTLPSGVLAVGEDFIVNGDINHSNGELKLTNNTGVTTLTLSGSDLATLRISGTATTSMTDSLAALAGDLLVESGGIELATNTISIAGSLDATGGIMKTASGTVLFNSSDSGETVDAGDNNFYNVVFAGAGGGWTLSSATTTNNFSLTSANNFTLASGETLVVNGVFLNTVGGAATNWNNTNLVLDGQNAYTVNTKVSGGDNYENLIISDNSDIRIWNSSATTTVVASSSSLYSQDHAALNGALNIYGDFVIATTTEYWSYATDFDGTALGGGSRQVTVSLADGASTTVTNAGTLRIIGGATATTTVQNQGSGDYAFVVNAGTVNMNYYALRDMNDSGLQLSGSPVVSSLSNGDYELSVNSGNLITLDVSVLDANPSLQILNTRFATTAPASTGVNVNLSATTTNNWTFRYEYGGLAGEDFDIDGITDCGSVRWDDSSCLLTEQTEYRWRHDDGGIGVPDSQWFDTNWEKRKRVRVANNDGSAYTNAVVMVTVPYDSDMQPDFDDLRFTSGNGVSPIDFWIERYTSSVSADVWIQVPSLVADGTASVFMYYDNAVATTISSSTATFSAIDDFEDDNLSEYSGDTTIMQTSGSFAYGGSFGLDLGTNQGTRLTNGIARFDQNIVTGQTIRYRQYVDTSAGASDESCTLFGVQSPVTAHQNYGVCLELFGVDRMTLAKNVHSTDSYGSVVRLATTTVTYTTGWYEVVVDWKTDNTIDVRLYNPSGTLVATTSATDATYSSGGYGFTSWGQNGGWDSFLVKPFIATLPTTFFGAEQTDGGATFAAAQNTPTSAFSVGDTSRLRIAIENTGLDITNQLFTIEYAAKGASPSCAAVPEVSYVAVPDYASCGSSAICMSTSTVVANGAVTTDLLDVARNTFTAGSFVESPSNKTSAIDVDQDFYTELEYSLAITNNASDQSYCFRLTNDGVPYDSYVNVPELSLKFDPVMSSVTLNEGIDISLIPGTTTTVYATGTVTDFNGFADLLLATSTIFRSGVSGGASCVANNNDCYISTTADSCQFTDCAGNSCTVSCSADIYFHADPTDTGSAYDGQEWLAFIEVEDISGGYDFASALGVELTTLRAIDVDGTIDYGTLQVNADTGAYNASTSVINQGNVEANIEILGTDLSDGADSVIPANQQKFATSTFTYGSCGSTCADLSSTTPVQIDIDLSKPAADNPPVADDVYWGIFVPFGVNSAAHQGINVFTPVSP